MEQQEEALLPYSLLCQPLAISKGTLTAEAPAQVYNHLGSPAAAATLEMQTREHKSVGLARVLTLPLLVAQ